jgi:hypothetical protein
VVTTETDFGVGTVAATTIVDYTLPTFGRNVNLDNVVKSRLKSARWGHSLSPFVLDARCAHWRHVMFTPRVDFVNERRSSTRRII